MNEMSERPDKRQVGAASLDSGNDPITQQTLQQQVEAVVAKQLTLAVREYFPAIYQHEVSPRNSKFEISAETEYSQVVARTQKKHIPEPFWQEADYTAYLQEQERLQAFIAREPVDYQERMQQWDAEDQVDDPVLTIEAHQDAVEQAYKKKKREFENRMNEDTARCGKGWCMVADGVTQRHKKVAGLMSEAIGYTVQAVAEYLHKIQTADAQQVKSALEAVPALAVEQLRKALVGNEVFQRIQQQEQRYKDKDFSATVEAIFHAPWLQKVFVLHLGDSRTYQVEADGTIRQITRDHKYPNGSLFSVVSLDQQSTQAIEVLEVEASLGMRLISLTDGNFQGHEKRMKDGQESRTIQEVLADLVGQSGSNKELLNAITDQGTRNQKYTGTWDDASGAVFELKM